MEQKTIFETKGGQWWEPGGPFQILHNINPLRLEYIVTHIKQHYDEVEGKTILDVGCGGGVLCEPLARLGADVTGIDTSDSAIEAAKAHSAENHLTISYEASTIEALEKHSEKAYDIITAMEVLEHVDDVGSFMQSARKLLKPGGLMFFATINRTLKSLALAKFAAEYILRWVPPGAHNWRQFLEPAELVTLLESNGLQAQNLVGLEYNMLKGQWTLGEDLSMNYMGVAKAPA